MPLEIRGAHFLIRSAELVRGTNTLRIGAGNEYRVLFGGPSSEYWGPTTHRFRSAFTDPAPHSAACTRVTVLPPQL